MEFSFVSDNSADASYLAQELEVALRQDGVPASALALKASSPENMDIGSVLSFSMEVATNVLGPAGSLAALAKCVFEVVTKTNSTVIIIKDDGKRIEVPASGIDFKRLEKAIGRSGQSKPKPRFKSRM
jgi:anti-sigma regulatory factor (Ser/Thr protein kinase)